MCARARAGARTPQKMLRSCPQEFAGRRAGALPPELLGAMADYHPRENPSSNGVARTVPESLLADHEAPPEALPTSAATRTAFLTPGAGTMRTPYEVKVMQRARSARWRSALTRVAAWEARTGRHPQGGIV